MNRERRIQTLVAVGAFGLWVACAIACRAAWSPDGSQILFPYYLDGERGVGVAVHDVKSGKTRSLREFLGAPKPRIQALALGWLLEKNRIVALALETRGTDRLKALVLDLETGSVVKEHDLGEVKPKDSGLLAFMLPLALWQGRFLFASTGAEVVRLDIERGSTEKRKFDGEIPLFSDGKSVFFLKESAPGREAVVGRLDPETLAPTPLLTLPEDPKRTVTVPAAIDPTTGRVALLKKAENDPPAVLIFQDGKLAQTVPVERPGHRGKLELMDPVWGPGGKSLFVYYATNANEADELEMGVCEILLEEKRATFLPLIQRKLKRDPFFLLSLSPDGRTLAALHTRIDEQKALDPSDPVLFLVDLSDPARKITRVHAPKSANPAPAAPKE